MDCLVFTHGFVSYISEWWPHKDCVQYTLLNRIDCLVQGCDNTISNALDLLQSCAKPSIHSKSLFLFRFLRYRWQYYDLFCNKMELFVWRHMSGSHRFHRTVYGFTHSRTELVGRCVTLRLSQDLNTFIFITMRIKRFVKSNMLTFSHR